MQDLAKKYGKEKPFKDNLLIDEIISMTYPQVADFFKNHVEGKVPINYMEYLNKVGLTMGETEVPLPSILFKDNQNPFFEPQPDQDGKVRYVVTGLNDTIESMGVEIGDVFLGLDGKMLPEIKKENAEQINAVFTPSFMWDDKKEFTITIQRNMDKQTLIGITGKPNAKVSGVVEDPNAAEKAMILRTAWLKN